MAVSIRPAVVPDARISEMVRRIVREFHPDKVILFGSYARGEAGSDSDADILVITAASGSRRELAVRIDMALFGIPLPADIIVVTPEDVARSTGRIGSFLSPALKEGKVLYERRA